MTYVIIDIETVENEKAKELFAKKTYLPAANLRDPAKIEQSILEKRQKDMDQAALHWWTGKIICICANVVGSVHEKPRTFIGDDEKELLQTFFDWLHVISQACSGVIVIGKSSDHFDVPFIVGRCLSHDIGVPNDLRRGHSLRDIDHIFSFSSQCDQRTTLENYAFGLGIDGKLNHSSKIAELYAEIQMGDQDKWTEIGHHCARDTDITTEMLKRWLKTYITRIEPESTPIDIPFG